MVKSKEVSLFLEIQIKGGVEVKNVKLCNVLNVNKALFL